MTRLQLITAIKREARIKNSTNLDTMVGEILNDVLVDYCNKTFYWELMKTDTAITAIAATGQYSLPADFQNLKQVRYGVGASPVTMRQLLPQYDTIRRTSTYGLPMYFYLSSGSKLNVFPYSTIAVGDTILIDYYINPTTNFTADGDNFPVPRIEAAVKKEVIARLERFHNDNQGDQSTRSDATQSFVASQSATSR